MKGKRKADQRRGTMLYWQFSWQICAGNSDDNDNSGDTGATKRQRERRNRVVIAILVAMTMNGNSRDGHYYAEEQQRVTT
jgi:hypothetical protein